MAKRLQAWVERQWYRRAQGPAWLLPLSRLFGWLARRRRRRYTLAGAQFQSLLPVIVIGNLTVGGTGKSPLAAWLVKRLEYRGFRPVIITRGYGGTAERFPLLVTPETAAAVCGDEPLMLARQTGVPVVVDPNRARAAEWAVSEGLGDILVSDDGLQHYRLARNLELVVFDGARGAGNGELLPAGPLREPMERLSEVTAVVVNGEPSHSTFARIRAQAPAFFTMTLVPQAFRRLSNGDRVAVSEFKGKVVHGVAGIGNPERFFKTLEELGATVRRHAFPDHHPFQPGDFPAGEEAIVMTAKDGVKCGAFARDHWFVLEVAAEPEPGLEELICRTLNTTGR